MSDTIAVEYEYLDCLESLALIAKRTVYEAETTMPHEPTWNVHLIPEHWYRQLQKALEYLQEYRDEVAE